MKQLRDAKKIAEALGLADVQFEQRRGTHFLMRASYRGQEIRTIVPARGAGPGFYSAVKTDLKRRIREAEL